MKDEDLKQRLDNLDKKIAEIKSQRDFEKRYNDGHKRSLEEIVQRYKDLNKKIEEDIENYEEKHGHISELERDLIVFLDSTIL